MVHRPKCIALTGGPGGGKSTLIGELKAEDRGNNRWLMVPEAAPLLFQAGLDGRAKSFQKAVVHMQVALEDILSKTTVPGQVIVCHRGTLDPLAYWFRNGWDETEFFEYTKTTRDQHYKRYFGVIHIQTAAIGAEESYRKWPDAHRPETEEQAAEIDRLLANAWGGHPRYAMIDNAGMDWETKSRAALDMMRRWMKSE